MSTMKRSRPARTTLGSSRSQSLNINTNTPGELDHDCTIRPHVRRLRPWSRAEVSEVDGGGGGGPPEKVLRTGIYHHDGRGDSPALGPASSRVSSRSMYPHVTCTCDPCRRECDDVGCGCDQLGSKIQSYNELDYSNCMWSGVDRCPICLDQSDPSLTSAFWPCTCCGNRTHFTCLLTWTHGGGRVCPLCRYELNPRELALLEYHGDLPSPPLQVKDEGRHCADDVTGSGGHYGEQPDIS